jgi:hypothetical protein
MVQNMLQQTDNNEWGKGTNFARPFVYFSHSLLSCRSPQLQHKSVKKGRIFYLGFGVARYSED